MSSNNLDKYEYLTGVDLGYKPSVTEEAKFEHSPLRKIFNKGQDEDDDKKEGLLKRLKNIEDENEERLTLFSRVNKTSTYLVLLPKFGMNVFTSSTFISYLSANFLQYFDNTSLETASFYAFYAFCAFCAWKIFSLKKRVEIALMTSFTLLLNSSSC